MVSFLSLRFEKQLDVENVLRIIRTTTSAATRVETLAPRDALEIVMMT